jgi:hypothetical protein
MNMPNGAINYTNRASTTVDGANESAYFPITVGTNGLRVGTNVLAVELHQSGPTTSDAGFDLELAGLIPRDLRPHLEISRAGSNYEIRWTVINAVLEAAARVNGPWSEIMPSGAGSHSASPTGSARFFRLRRL